MDEDPTGELVFLNMKCLWVETIKPTDFARYLLWSQIQIVIYEDLAISYI